ncbi:hypothetical protein GDO78_020935 [Eleutherodactylus coqui]|uniref:Tc1-like transposase DDE domain-containing protein n=1 Tax=Eleutherodactylus coqui TaxID=57060 RepID=A0A8J6BNN9_ELECQ|nr:hypothetical protein GDO78_020935 [Eleutherodactylus coqui]
MNQSLDIKYTGTCCVYSIGADGIFYEDNATCHMARNVQQQLEEHNQDLQVISQRLWDRNMFAQWIRPHPPATVGCTAISIASDT